MAAIAWPGFEPAEWHFEQARLALVKAATPAAAVSWLA
jgi:hypothetical protein